MKGGKKKNHGQNSAKKNLDVKKRRNFRERKVRENAVKGRNRKKTGEKTFEANFD